MAYEVLARKWRPQQFKDVVGQTHVTRTLENAIETDRVAHAYLLVGPRGTGKTTTARIFSKALNCERGPTTTPCDQCDACREIMAGTHLDVLEIDGASNTGVDHIRDLRENVKFAPSRGPFKIYIIDEVHMLSSGAFNALLKTLEEPPAHVKFVFATTEPQKIPPTILSRCQRFDLRRIASKEIMTRLREICAAEGFAVDEQALFAIARGAEGGMRDAQSALDQLVAFRGKTIQEEDVLAVFGLVAQGTLDELVQATLEGDVAKQMSIVAELDANGRDLQRLVIELLEYFRNILVSLYARDAVSAIELPESQMQNVRRLAQGTTAERVLRVVQILIETDNHMRYALSKRTLVETALIRSARAAAVASIEEVLAQLESLKAKVEGSGPAPAPRGAGAGRRAADPALSTTTEDAPANAKGETPPDEATEASGSATQPTDPIGMLVEQWHAVVERVGEVAPLAKNYLLDAKPVRIDNGKVVIGFDPEFAENKGKIDFPRNRKAIEKTLEIVLRQPVGVTFCVLESEDTLPGDVKFEQSGSEKRPKKKAPEAEKPKATRTRQEWMKNPTVQKTLEMFNGDIVDIRE